MVTVAQIRTKLQDKIFTPYGKSVTLKHAGTHTYNDMGDITAYSWTSTTVTIVPYDLMAEKQSFQPFSNFSEGDFSAAVPYSVTVSVGDQVVMDSLNWEVKEVINHELPTNAVILIRLSKIVA